MWNFKILDINLNLNSFPNFETFYINIYQFEAEFLKNLNKIKVEKLLGYQIYKT